MHTQFETISETTEGSVTILLQYICTVMQNIFLLWSVMKGELWAPVRKELLILNDMSHSEKQLRRSPPGGGVTTELQSNGELNSFAMYIPPSLIV